MACRSMQHCRFGGCGLARPADCRVAHRRATSIRCRRPTPSSSRSASPTFAGWAEDDHAAAFATFRTSCNPFLSRAAPSAIRGRCGARCSEVCRRAAAAGALDKDKDKARAFFEQNFRPVRIAKLGETHGIADRLLRADRRRLALPEPGIFGAALPAPARSGVARARSQHRQLSRTAPRSASSTPRSSSSPITTASPSRTAHSTAQRLEIAWIRNRLGGDDHPDPGLRPRAARRRHHAAAQLRRPQRPFLHRRSAAS